MRALSLAVAVSMLWVPVAAQAASLRCGTALVADGASKSDVIAKCGEPIAKETRAESEEVKTRDGDTSSKRVVQKTFEEWTYNFGPNRLMQVVVFENGKLIDVKSAGYGR
jgi:hypothetical protein